MVKCQYGVKFRYSAFATRQNVSPKPRHEGNVQTSSQAEIAKRVSSWTPEDKNNAWELSGQFEGDIMLYENTAIKNALQDDNARWTKAVVPYSVDGTDFCE
ncbi:uncharacterized protein LOC110837118 [Zootermopsis nevadensis]|uniref:uncharacterized protein LOC110837118 n=1 Tax=Zootermopsis nevadensis TaxID=136037 RepID=UPI000B8EBE1E|nr:uncharacterized protein LOC110837118 [Zootermopsis nevadensis]